MSQKVEKKLGKIRTIQIGSGGYQSAMFEVSFDLGGEGWGDGDFWGFWSEPPSKNSKWTRSDQLSAIGESFLKLQKIMNEAKVNDAFKLKGAPVEISFESNRLVGWRILEEVI